MAPRIFATAIDTSTATATELVKTVEVSQSGMKAPSTEARTGGNIVSIETNPSFDSTVLTETRTLYPNEQGGISRIAAGIDCLTAVANATERAIALIESGSPLEADDVAMEVQLGLRRLYMYRGIGNGFALVSNSLMIGVENLNGVPPTAGQLRAVKKVLRLLYEHPILSTEKAMAAIDDLDDAGLNSEDRHLPVLLNAYLAANETIS